jgi:hypothetical protein
MAALIAWMLVVHVDDFVKDRRPPKGRRFAPSLTKSSTRTECCPSDQGRFLGLTYLFDLTNERLE